MGTGGELVGALRRVQAQAARGVMHGIAGVASSVIPGFSGAPPGGARRGAKAAKRRGGKRRAGARGRGAGDRGLVQWALGLGFTGDRESESESDVDGDGGGDGGRRRRRGWWGLGGRRKGLPGTGGERAKGKGKGRAEDKGHGSGADSDWDSDDDGMGGSDGEASVVGPTGEAVAVGGSKQAEAFWLLWRHYMPLFRAAGDASALSRQLAGLPWDRGVAEVALSLATDAVDTVPGARGVVQRLTSFVDPIRRAAAAARSGDAAPASAVSSAADGKEGEDLPALGSLEVLTYPHVRLLAGRTFKGTSKVKTLGSPAAAMLARRLREAFARVEENTASFARDGTSLAGPQLGLSLRVIVLPPAEGGAMATVVFNPKVVPRNGAKPPAGSLAQLIESDPSLPGLSGVAVSGRAAEVDVHGRDELGRAIRLRLAGRRALGAQRAVDHLQGILLLDRVAPDALVAMEPKLRALEVLAAQGMPASAVMTLKSARRDAGSKGLDGTPAAAPEPAVGAALRGGEGARAFLQRVGVLGGDLEWVVEAADATLASELVPGGPSADVSSGSEGWPSSSSSSEGESDVEEERTGIELKADADAAFLDRGEPAPSSPVDPADHAVRQAAEADRAMEAACQAADRAAESLAAVERGEAMVEDLIAAWRIAGGGSLSRSGEVSGEQDATLDRLRSVIVAIGHGAAETAELSRESVRAAKRASYYRRQCERSASRVAHVLNMDQVQRDLHEANMEVSSALRVFETSALEWARLEKERGRPLGDKAAAADAAAAAAVALGVGECAEGDDACTLLRLESCQLEVLEEKVPMGLVGKPRDDAIVAVGWGKDPDDHVTPLFDDVYRTPARLRVRLPAGLELVEMKQTCDGYAEPTLVIGLSATPSADAGDGGGSSSGGDESRRDEAVDASTVVPLPLDLQSMYLDLKRLHEKQRRTDMKLTAVLNQCAPMAARAEAGDAQEVARRAADFARAQAKRSEEVVTLAVSKLSEYAREYGMTYGGGSPRSAPSPWGWVAGSDDVVDGGGDGRGLPVGIGRLIREAGLWRFVDQFGAVRTKPVTANGAASGTPGQPTRAALSAPRLVRRNCFDAYHEAGHAMVAALMPEALVLLQSSLPREGDTAGAPYSQRGTVVAWCEGGKFGQEGSALLAERARGAVVSGAAPLEGASSGRMWSTRSGFVAEAAALLGGLAAEELMFGRADQYEAASEAVVGDLAVLSDVAVRYRAAVKRALRAGDIGFFAADRGLRSQSDFRETYRRDLGLPHAGPHNADTLRLADEGYALARSLLDPARMVLHQVAGRLSDGEAVSGAQVLDMVEAHGAAPLWLVDSEAGVGVGAALRIFDAAEAGVLPRSLPLPTWRFPSWVK